jgi:NTE family protein
MPSVGVVAVDPPPDADAAIGRSDLAAHASEPQVRALSGVVDWWYLAPGTSLFDTGDDADGMYLVVRGRLESRAGDDVLGEVAPGDTIGDTAVLGPRARTSDARAIRDTLVARLTPDRLPTLAATSPDMSRDVTRRAARRGDDGPRPVRGRPPVRSLAVVSLDGARDAHDWARRLTDSLDRLGTTRLVGSDENAGWVDGGGEAVAAGVAAAEAAADVVVMPLSADHGERAGNRLLLRHVDAVLAVAGASGVADPAALDLLRDAGVPVALALVDRPGRATPTSARWLDRVGREAEIRSHAHLHDGDVGDLDRLARALRGRAIGLVLGGGGSRGFAHIGVLRALGEAGITVDRVGGSSMGAIMAAQVAMGWTPDEMLERNVAAWSRRRLLEFGIPTLSVLRGRRARRVLYGLFGETHLEDLWLDCFCTTVDLSTYDQHVARRGRVADWVGASSTVPGLWPPLVDHLGHLHVDGGLLDNVPTGVMRAGHSGYIIGVDVCHRQSPMSVRPGSVLPAGLALVRARLGGVWSPTILDVVSRGNLLASLQQLDRSARFADLYVTPPAEEMGFAAFDRIHELADLGYRTTIAELERADGLVFD